MPRVTTRRTYFGIVAADGLHHRVDQLVARQRDIEGDDLRRGVQPVDVGVEFEYPAVVDPDTLEHAVTVEKTVVEDAYLGVFLAVELAIDVDLHVTLLGRAESACRRLKYTKSRYLEAVIPPDRR